MNSNKYCSQFDNLKAALNEKHLEVVNRKPIIFHQGNGRLHVSLNTRRKLLQHGWEVLIHLTYSLDIAPSDLSLFQSLHSPLNGKNSNLLEVCKRHLEQLYAQKYQKFWQDRIMKLLEKCWKVVKQNSEYVVQLSSQ